MSFSNPWVLWLLPLALGPLLAPGGEALRNGWLAFAPRDRLSSALGWALRGLAALAVAALVVAVADPHRPEYTVERVGRGAEIVLLLDRSRSMDQGFAGGRAPPGGRLSGPEAIDYYFSQAPARLRESKGKVARQLLSDFTAQRPDDRFALIVFSTLPMRVLGFTQKEAIIQRGDRRRQRRPRPVGDQHRAGARGGLRAVRWPALRRLAHRHAGLGRRRPHRPRPARAPRGHGAQAACVGLLALPPLGQQPRADGRGG